MRSLCIFILCAPLGAQITVDQAMKEAVEKNLWLPAERYNVSIAEARKITARLRPNPVFSAELDYQDIADRGRAAASFWWTPSSSPKLG